MGMRRVGYFLLAVCFFVSAQGVFFAAAQTPSLDQQTSLNSEGLRVSPAIFDAVIKPGQTIKKDFVVAHTTDKSLPVQIQPRPLDPIEKSIDSGKINSFNAADWIKVNEAYHIFQNQESRKLTATITAPKNAEPGGHYAMISIDVLAAATDKAQSGVTVTSRIGILAFLVVPGPTVKKLSVDKGLAPLFGTSELIRLNPTFKNTGTIHVMQNTKLEVQDILGIKKTELAVPPRIILPNTVKTISVPWQDAPLVGIYKVKLVGTYGPDQSTISSDTEYMVMVRWLPLLLVGLPLIVVAWLVLRTRGRWDVAIAAFRNPKNSKPAPREKVYRMSQARKPKKKSQ